MYKEQFINQVTIAMIPYLSEPQVQMLKDVLNIKLLKYSIDIEETELMAPTDTNDYIIKAFLQSKLASNTISGKTTKMYSYRLNAFFNSIGKNFSDINANDIRAYLAKERISDSTGKPKAAATMSTIYNVLSSFFAWCFDNEYIKTNPMNKVEPYKKTKEVKQPFTEEEVTAIKDACDNIRDLAIIDFLDSSMVRCSELCGINISDVDFRRKECIVLGKGHKERMVYFDAQTAIHLQEYIKTRKDGSDALFVSERAPYSRLSVSGVERIISNLGEKAGVVKAHPHRFRRTGATRCLKAGIPLNAIQTMLGHSNITTTQIYARIDDSEVKHLYNTIYQ